VVAFAVPAHVQKLVVGQGTAVQVQRVHVVSETLPLGEGLRDLVVCGIGAVDESEIRRRLMLCYVIRSCSFFLFSFFVFGMEEYVHSQMC
jgi:hypothetical protein